MAGTRKVRMIVGISGERHDGTRWPPAGTEIEVPGWEADDLINGGNAVAVGDESKVRAGETVRAWTPAGTTVTNRPLTPEEVMTGHPDDPAAGLRAGEDQYGGRAAHEGDVIPDRGRRDDPRPDSQIIAEDLSEDEAERVGLGELDLDKAKAGPAGERRKGREADQKATAARRHAERNSALRYAEDGVSGAPGSEVPRHEGEAVVAPEGVRPLSQVEGEDAGRAADESDWARSERESREHQAGDSEVPVAGQPSREFRAGDENRAGHQAGHVEGDSDLTHVTAPVVVDSPAGEAPSPGDPKQAWVDHAVASGADVHEAAGMTKADLMSRYGGRL